MNDIQIKITDKIAYCPKKHLISSNKNYRIVFSFDEEWNESYIKTARIIFSGQSIDLVMEGNTVDLPPIPVCSRISVGVFSDKLASTAVEIGCIASIADIDCESAFEFTESQYDQIVELLNEADLRKIESISRRDGYMVILYTDGTENLVPLIDGVSVSSAELNEKSELILTLTDGTNFNCGNVRGEKGDTPDFSVGRVESLEADNDAYVTVTGNALHPVLNFGIPKGRGTFSVRTFAVSGADTSFNNIRNTFLEGNYVVLSEGNSDDAVWYMMTFCKLWGANRCFIFSGNSSEFKITPYGITSAEKSTLPPAGETENGKILTVENGSWVAKKINFDFSQLSESDKQTLADTVIEKIPSAEGKKF